MRPFKFNFKLRKSAVLIVSLSLALLYGGCSGQRGDVEIVSAEEDIKTRVKQLRESPPNIPVIRLGKNIITKQELGDSFIDLYKKPKSGVTDEEVIKSVLEYLFIRNYLYIEARDRGYEGDPALTMQWNVRATLWLGEYFISKEKDKFNIDREIIKSLLPEGASAVKFSQITVEDLASAQDLRSRVVNGGEFAEIARKYSIDPSAENGGELKRYHIIGLPSIYGDGLLEKIMKYGEGEVSQIIDTPMGYTFFRIDSKRPIDDEEKHKFFQRKEYALRSDVTSNFLRSIREKYPMMINDQNLLDSINNPESDLIIATVGSYDITYGFLKSYLEGQKRADGDFEYSQELLTGSLNSIHPNLAYREEAVAQGMLTDELVKENFSRVKKYTLMKTIVNKLWEESEPDEEEVYNWYRKKFGSGTEIGIFSVNGYGGLDQRVGAQLEELISQGNSLKSAMEKLGISNGIKEINGTFQEDQFSRSALMTLEKTPAGEITELVRTESGEYAIYEVQGKNRGEMPPYDQVYKGAKSKVQSEKSKLLNNRVSVRWNQAVKPEYLYAKIVIDGLIVEWLNQRKALHGVSPPGGFHDKSTSH